LLLAGCGDSRGVDTPFEAPAPVSVLPGTRFCLPDGKGGFTNSADFYQKFEDGNDFRKDDKRYPQDGPVYSATGGGCIARPIREVWAVTHNEDALVWKDADKAGFKSLENPDVPFAFRTQYEAGPKVFKRVNWVMEWYHYLRSGTLSAPSVVEIQFQRTVGTRFLKRFKGTIVLQALAPNVTGYLMEMQEVAGNVTEKNARGAVVDIYEHLSDSRIPPNWEYFNKK
jgi:hypothetical protein